MAALGLVTEAFALGVSSGPVCLASCTPVLLPVLAAERKPLGGTGIILGEFLTGRLGGYLVFACLAWFAGITLSLQSHARAVAFGLSDLAMAGLLAGYGWTLGRRQKAGCEHACPATRARRFADRFGVFAPFCMGFASGVSLCPPFVAAGLRAVQTGAFVNAIIFFVWFFAGTAIWFIPSVGLGMLRRIESVALVARLMLFLLAAYYGYLTFIVLGGLFIHG